MGKRHPSAVIGAVATSLTTAIVLAVAILLITSEQAATQRALKQARDERENATRSTEIAQLETKRAGHSVSVALHSLGVLVQRLHTAKLPDVPQLAEMRPIGRGTL